MVPTATGPCRPPPGFLLLFLPRRRGHSVQAGHAAPSSTAAHTNRKRGARPRFSASSFLLTSGPPRPSLSALCYVAPIARPEVSDVALPSGHGRRDQVPVPYLVPKFTLKQRLGTEYEGAQLTTL
ncbi:hypothetical protein NDU88_002432 [Pleurodeles waltl]|uniref:Uncharacterized protein n=1 Tax=Pleurodeles waltl TaxID=8319 RepID=A0AAV7PF91_PLEWA|nr:hypothetical protein NDU88_002432 [Pleurodeles waltl]